MDCTGYFLLSIAYTKISCKVTLIGVWQDSCRNIACGDSAVPIFPGSIIAYIDEKICWIIAHWKYLLLFRKMRSLVPASTQSIHKFLLVFFRFSRKCPAHDDDLNLVKAVPHQDILLQAVEHLQVGIVIISDTSHSRWLMSGV